MKKLLFAFIALFLFALTLSAQDDRVKKKVNLKDGTELIGFVSKENGMTKITTEDGDVFYYLEKEIKEIESLVKGPTKKEAKDLKKSKKNVRKGYFGTVGLSATTGSFTGRLTTIHGYRYKGFHIGLGAGIGYGGGFEYAEYEFDGYQYGYKTYQASYISLPVFFHLSQEFCQTKVAPFIEFNGGYDVMAAYMEFCDMSYPYMLQLLFGLNFNFKKKSAFRLAGGYDLMYGPVASLTIKF